MKIYKSLQYGFKKRVSAIIFMEIGVKMGKIVIDNSRCKSCYICTTTCPKGLIKKSSKTNRLGDYMVEFDEPKGECVGCAMCAKRCPDMAITEVYR